MIRLFCGLFRRLGSDVRILKVKIPCRATSGCRLPNSHAQYNLRRALTAVHFTGLRVFFRMFLYVIIFSKIKTDCRGSESASFLRPHAAAGTFVHPTPVNH